MARTQAGAQSATWFFPYDAEVASVTLTDTDWAALPAGKLKSLLNRTYLTSGGSIDPAGFLEAFAVAGGKTSTTVAVTNANDLTNWLLSDGGEGDAPKGTPKLMVNTIAGGYGTVARIETAYSASE